MSRANALAAVLWLSIPWLCLAGSASAGDDIASTIQSEADYATAFDRETDGLFGALVEAGDLARTLEGYPAIVAAYVRLEDALFEAKSHHAISMPPWYSGQLLAMGLDEIPVESGAEAFFVAELQSGEFDRVVHAYYLVSRSRLPLIKGETPTLLWRTAVQVAREDAEDRYWISLTIAESRRLPDRLYDRLHTKMATRTESVRERIGRNADWLGPRISRVLGADTDDLRLSHVRIRYAQVAALRRVREHELLAMGGVGAYRSMRDELGEMESGEFQSKRFLAVMRVELPLLFEHFGLPEDPKRMLETVRFLCRGRGSNRMSLWDAADDLAKLYEPAMAAKVEATKPVPLPDAAAVVDMGDDAWGYVAKTLADTGSADTTEHLFETDAIPTLAAEREPEDPDAIRRAIRNAYHALGFPTELRDAYQRALDALGPEESTHAAASRETLDALRQRFEGTEDAASFEAAFDAFRGASTDGRIPSRDVDPGFVSSFAAAAVPLLETEASRGDTARENAVAARRAHDEAAAEIETAEAEIVDANRQIREANLAIETEEERQHAAMAARNSAVEQLNEAVARAETARRGSGDFEDARAEAKALESELNELIRNKEAEFHAAGAALEAAEERAVVQLKRARRDGARATAGATRENEAFEDERRAEKELQQSEARFADLLSRFIAGLGFVGIHGDVGALGEPEQDEAIRLAAMALLLEASEPADASQLQALGRERDGSNPGLRSLAALTLRALERSRRPGE